MIIPHAPFSIISIALISVCAFSQSSQIDTIEQESLPEKAYGYFGTTEPEEFKTLDQMRAAMYLNESLNTLTRIMLSGDRIVLQEEQDRLDNIWEWKGTTDFISVLNYRKSLQLSLNELTKNEINKERYREAFERKNNAAARDAFLNAISGVQVNINPFALVTNILISSARSYMDYNKRKDDLAVELDDQLWKLEQSEMDELARLRQQVQDIYIETFKDFELENNMGLKISEIELFYHILEIGDYRLRAQELLDAQNTFQYFAPYWYERGNTYIHLFEATENRANLNEAMTSFDRYVDMNEKCQLYRYDPRLGMIAVYELMYRQDLSVQQKESLLEVIVDNIRTNGSARLYAALYYINELGKNDEGLNILRSNLNPEVSGHNETVLAAATYWDSFTNDDLKDLFCKKVVVAEGVDLESYIAFWIKLKQEPAERYYPVQRQLQKSLSLEPIKYKKDEITRLALTSKSKTLRVNTQNIQVLMEERRLSKNERQLTIYELFFAHESKFFKDRASLEKKIKTVKYFKKHPNQIDAVQLISKIKLGNTDYYYVSSTNNWDAIVGYLGYASTKQGTKKYNQTEYIENQYRKFYSKYAVDEIDYVYSISKTETSDFSDMGFEPTYTFKVTIPHYSEDPESAERYSVTLCFLTDRIKNNDTFLHLTGMIFNNEYIKF